VWLALVVFTSGIVDDASACGVVSSQYYSLLLSCLQLGGVGVEPGGMGLGVGVGTLLSPEASAVRQVSLAGPFGDRMAFQDQFAV
jgi:hypothetical protein